jgi:hypothetical protein
MYVDIKRLIMEPWRFPPPLGLIENLILKINCTVLYGMHPSRRLNTKGPRTLTYKNASTHKRTLI